MTDTNLAKIRLVAYTAVAGMLGLLVVLGYVTQDQSDMILAAAGAVLEDELRSGQDLFERRLLRSHPNLRSRHDEQLNQLRRRLDRIKAEAKARAGKK